MARSLLSADNSYINCGNIPEISGISKMTMAFWSYKLLTADSILVGQSTATEIIQLAQTTDDKFYLTVDFSPLEYAYPAAQAINKWLYAMFVFDGTQAVSANRYKLYVNGISLALTHVGTHPTITATITNPFYIGYRTYGTVAGNGRYGDTKIWTDALTAQEALKAYNLLDAGESMNDYYRNNIPKFDKLIAFWRPGSKNVVENLAQNKYHGTYVNSASTRVVRGPVIPEYFEDEDFSGFVPAVAGGSLLLMNRAVANFGGMRQ